MTKTSPSRLSAYFAGRNRRPDDPPQRIDLRGMDRPPSRKSSSPYPMLPADAGGAGNRDGENDGTGLAAQIGERIADSVVAAGTVVAGDIIFSGRLRIDGEVRCNVCSPDGQAAELVVGVCGRVNGNIQVTRLAIYGMVTGGVYAGDSVVLHSGAHVSCDIRAGAVEIRLGGIVQGHLMVQPPGQPDRQP